MYGGMDLWKMNVLSLEVEESGMMRMMRVVMIEQMSLDEWHDAVIYSRCWETRDKRTTVVQTLLHRMCPCDICNMSRLKPRLHLIHVARIQVASTCIHLYPRVEHRLELVSVEVYRRIQVE